MLPGVATDEVAKGIPWRRDKRRCAPDLPPLQGEWWGWWWSTKMSFALDVRTLFYVMWPECLNSGLRIGKILKLEAIEIFQKSAPVVTDTDP